MLLKRNPKERVEAARKLADLAKLHPDQQQQIKEQAAEAVAFWIGERLEPHANGLRALAAMGASEYGTQISKWADPKEPLPLEGQQGAMPRAWETAQSALRYVGWMQLPNAWDMLKRQLTRRPPKLDITREAMVGQGVSMLGMALSALSKGSSAGFAEWGDNRAFPILLEFIEETQENEESRMAACSAMAWVANDEDMIKVAEKIGEYSSDDKKDQFRRECLLETLTTRPVSGSSVTEALLTLLVPESSMKVRHAVARAIGKSGIDENIEAKLFEKMGDEALKADAALTLFLGASPAAAARALAMFSGASIAAMEELQELWFFSFGYWSDKDLEDGHIFRYVRNAEAMNRVEFGETPQLWAGEQLRRQFVNLVFDNGPHSFTRVVLRKRLYDMAKGDDEAKRKGAIETLEFMKERGVLLDLRDVEGPTGKLASEAYHNLVNPRVAMGVKDFSEDNK
jgi:hypothetical protein